MIIKKIEISGNKVTQQSIVLRELLFIENDTITNEELILYIEKSRDNLLKTSLFNFVHINTGTIQNNEIKILINLEERWYTWPTIYFNHADRNFNTWLKSGDLSRVNYGIGLTRYNFRGRQEKFSVYFIAGYSNQVAFSYRNLYIDKNRKHSFDFDFFFENQSKLDYKIVENVPVEIETRSKIFRKNSFFLHYTFRNKIYEKYQIIFSYYNYNISDTIVLLNSEFLGSSRMKANFTGISLRYENDHRDLKYYPLKGYYFNCEIDYYGLFSKDFRKPELSFSIHKFFQLSPSFYLHTGINSQLTVKQKQPYILKAALGYDYNLRGFDDYVIGGYNYYLFKTNLKYRVLPEKIINLRFIPFRQFNKIHISAFLNLFFDSGYIHDYYNLESTESLANKYLYSFGSGLDIVTYYDKMLRMDIARNSLGDWGIFFTITQHF